MVGTELKACVLVLAVGLATGASNTTASKCLLDPGCTKYTTCTPGDRVQRGPDWDSKTNDHQDEDNDHSIGTALGNCIRRTDLIEEDRCCHVIWDNRPPSYTDLKGSAVNAAGKLCYADEFACRRRCCNRTAWDEREFLNGTEKCGSYAETTPCESPETSSLYWIKKASTICASAGPKNLNQYAYFCPLEYTDIIYAYRVAECTGFLCMEPKYDLCTEAKWCITWVDIVWIVFTLAAEIYVRRSMMNAHR